MREKSAGWNKTLWTDQASHDEWKINHQDKLSELAAININVKPVEDQIDKRNQGVYKYALKHDARTMASDVARYNVLKNHGGIYADLDMAPGELSLPNSATEEGGDMLSSGKLPFFGAEIRNRQTVEKTTPNSRDTFEERLQQTIDTKYKQRRINNNLIAVEPDNPTIDLMIDKISKLKEGNDDLDLKPDKEHLEQIAPAITGPGMIKKVMQEQMKLSTYVPNVPQAVEHMNPYLKDNLTKHIKLLTEAS